MYLDSCSRSAWFLTGKTEQRPLLQYWRTNDMDEAAFAAVAAAAAACSAVVVRKLRLELGGCPRLLGNIAAVSPFRAIGIRESDLWGVRSRRRRGRRQRRWRRKWQITIDRCKCRTAITNSASVTRSCASENRRISIGKRRLRRRKLNRRVAEQSDWNWKIFVKKISRNYRF